MAITIAFLVSKMKNTQLLILAAANLGRCFLAQNYALPRSFCTALVVPRPSNTEALQMGAHQGIEVDLRIKWLNKSN